MYVMMFSPISFYTFILIQKISKKYFKKTSFAILPPVSYLFFPVSKVILVAVLLGQFFFKSQIVSFATCGVCVNRPSYSVTADSFTVSEECVI